MAYSTNSTLTAARDLSITALSTASINAGVGAGSVAVALGLKGNGNSLALSGSGVLANNKVGIQLKAYVDGDGAGLNARSVSVTADDGSYIKATAGAAALAVSVAKSNSGALSIGVALARNEISNDVAAYIRNAVNGVKTTSGNVSVSASSHGNNLFQLASTAQNVATFSAGLNADTPDATFLANLQTAFSNHGVGLSGAATDLKVTVLKPGAEWTVFDGGSTYDIRLLSGALVVYQSSIEAISVAASVAVGVGLGGAGVALSGAGAEATNTIQTDVKAYIEGSAVNSGGGVVVGASSTGSINATVASVSIAVGIALGGSGAGVGVSVGVAVSRNQIGMANATSTPFKYTLDSQNVTDLNPGDTVEINAGARSGDVYKYVGSAQHDSNGINLNSQDYANSDLWQQVGLQKSGGNVLAYLSGSSVKAVGDITVTAVSGQSIKAGVGAGSAGVSGGSKVGVALSGAGVSNENSIAATVQAYISGDGTGPNAGISGRSVTLTATDASNIVAVAGAASLAASFGSDAGISLSIGVSLARNNVGNDVQAYIINANDGITTTSGTVSLVASESASIKATSVAVSLAAGIGGKAGIAVSGAGAEATNVILTNVNAHIDTSKVTSAGAVSLSASNTSTINATIVAASVAVGIGGKAGIGVSIGAAVSRNLIGYTLDGSYSPTQVQAYLLNSSLNAAGALTLTANSNQSIDATVVAASMAVAGGGKVGVAASGSGVSTTNKMGALVKAYIDGTGTTSINVASVNLSAQDSSAINANAGAASLAASFGGTAGVSISIGVALARNTIANVVDAAIKNASNGVTTTTGAVTLNALENATIKAVSVAASIAAGFGGTVGVAIGGGGAEATNVILTGVNAHIDGSNVTSAGAASLSASNASTINANIPPAASVSVGGGGTAGVGVSIGAAMARNLIGYALDGTYTPTPVQAYLLNSSLNANGALTLTANSSQSIDATVVAASMAVTGGGTDGVGAIGSGVSTTNQMCALVRAYLDGTGTTGINAASVNLSAQDSSTINANAGAASLAASFGGTAGASVSIGVALAQNIVTNQVEAAIKNASNGVTTASGAVTLNALESATIKALSVAASIAAGFAGTAGVAISGAGAEATNVILTSINAHIDGSNVTSAGAASLTATNTSTINATIVGASAAVGGGGTAGVGVSIGAAVARNLIGYALDGSYSPTPVQAYLLNSSLNAAGALTLTANSNQSIDATVVAASMAVAGGGTAGVAASGSGVSATNQMAAQVEAFIDGAGANGVKAASAGLSAQDSSSINADAGAASLAVSFGGTAGVSVSIGVSLARNTIANVVDAAIKNASNGVTTTSGAVTLNALESATIKVVSVAASIAAGFGGTAGVAISGAGAESTNVILTKVNAHIDTSTVTSAGAVSLSAINISAINAKIVGASVAVGGGGTAGVGVSIGVALARNLIGYNLSGGNSPAEVQAYLSNSSLITTGALTLTAYSNQTINAIVVAASAAIAGGGVAGVGASGAGASTKNTIATNIKAYIDGDGATGIRVGSVGLYAQDTSSITADTGAASLAASFAGTAGVSLSIGVALAQNTIANVVDVAIKNADNGVTTTSGSVTLNATENTTIKALSVAASAAVGVAGAAGIALSGAGANAVNVILTQTYAHVDNSVLASAAAVQLTATNASSISAQIVAASAAIGGGGAAGVGASIGASVAHNYIGWKDDNNAQAAQVQAYVSNASITSAGALALSASSTETIDATVYSGSVALAGGGAAGVGASGAGSSTVNKVKTFIQAYIDGASTNISAGSVSLSATDASTITSTAGSASLAGAIGTVGVGVSVGISLAQNEISNEIAAYISNAASAGVNTTVGAITLNATNQATITAASKAASAAVSIGLVGVSFSGAGADAKNVILTKTNAYITNSQLNSVGDVNLSATDTSSLTAHVYALSAAVGGGAVGVGVAIGSSTAKNLIGQTLSGAAQPAQVGAYITTSKLTVGGGLSLVAIENATINAGIDSISAAVGGGAVGVAASGAGVNVQNYLATQVQAYIDSSPNIQTKSGINMKAQDTSTIIADGLAAAVSASFGVISGSVAIGVALADNTINNTIATFINGSTVKTTGGNVALQSLESASIISTSRAAAVSVSAGLGVALSGGGAKAQATVQGVTKSSIDKSNLDLAGGLNISAISASTAKATVDVTSVSIGLISAAASGSVANVTISPTVDTHIANSTVKAMGDIGLQSQASIITAEALANGLTASTGVSMGGSNATVYATPKITSTMDSSTVSSTSGSIALASRYNLDANGVGTGKSFSATAFAASGGLLLGGSMTKAVANATPTLETRVDSLSALNAYRDINLLALSSDTATSKATGAAGGLIGIGLSVANATVNGNVMAHLDGKATAGGSASLRAVAMDTAQGKAQAVSGGLIAVGDNDSTASVLSTAQAYLGSSANFTVGNNLSITATDSPEGDATTKGTSVGGVTIGGSTSEVNINPTASAYIGTGATVTQQNVGGTISVNASVLPPTPNAAAPDYVIKSANASADTLTVPSNGLPSGTAIQYDNGTPLQSDGTLPAADSLGLQGGRVYSVVTTADPNAIAFGALFNGADAKPDGTIKLQFAHNFVTGDQVVLHTNGGNVTNLTDGGIYYVRVLDNMTIKLTSSKDQAINPQNYLKSFAASAVTNNAITIANNGFADGQAVTYHTAAPQQFSSSVVDVILDSNGKPSDSPTANNIYIDNNAFIVGDKLAYTVTGGPAIGGLVSGNTYTVKSVNGNLITLTDPTDSSKTLALSADKSDAGKQAKHTFTQVGMGGLVDGTTYYVKRTDANTFQLAATMGGAALNLNGTVTGSSTVFRIGIDNIYFGAASGNGLSLTINLTSGNLPTTGTPKLLGVGGVSLSSTVQASGDGISSAEAEGSGAGFIAVNGNESYVTENPTVKSYIGDTVKLNAVGNVSITSLSRTSSSAHAQNGSGGFIAVGNALSSSTVNSDNQAYVGKNANLTVGGDFTLSADAGSNHGDVYTSTEAGGLAGVVNSKAYATTNFVNTIASINSSTTLTVAGKLLISANNSANGSVTTYANGNGAAGLADASSKNTVTGKAIVLLDSNAIITADTATLLATSGAGGSTLKSKADARGGGIYAQATSDSELNENLQNNITLASGVKLTGTNGVDILAYFTNLSTDSVSYSRIIGLFAYLDSTSNNNTTLDSTITANSGSLVTAGPRGPANTNLTSAPDGDNQLGLYVNNSTALDNNVSIGNWAHSNKYGLFAFGGDNGDKHDSRTRNIVWNGDLSILGPKAELTVAADGTISRQINVATSEANGIITVSKIVNVPNTLQTHFASGSISGSGGTWKFRDAFQSVTITNYSSKTILIQGVDLSTVVNASGTTPAIHLVASSSNTLQKTITHDTTPGGTINLQNLGVGAISIIGTVTSPTPPSSGTPTGTGTGTPAKQDQVFRVGGVAGGQTTLQFSLSARNSTNTYEIGIYLVDDATGKIGTLKPGDAGYLQAALSQSRAKTLFNSSSVVSGKSSLSLTNGSYYGFYLIVNPSSISSVGFGPNSTAVAGYNNNNVFLSFQAANNGGIDRMKGSLASGGVQLGWNNKGSTFQDMVITAQGFDLSGQFVGTPMMAASAGTNGSAAAITAPSDIQLAAIVAQAKQNWIDSGQISAATLAQLDQVNVQMANLGGLMIGEELGTTILLDQTAAGNGWFVDLTPGQNDEFIATANGLLANPGSDAAGKMDLLTVVEHEMGHVLGLEHTVQPGQVMDATLAAGIRLVLYNNGALPVVAQASQSTTVSAEGSGVSSTPVSSLAQSQGNNGTGMTIVANPVVVASSGLDNQSPALGTQTHVFDEQIGRFVPSKTAHNNLAANNFAVYINLDQNSVRRSLYDLHEDLPSFIDGQADTNKPMGMKPAKPAVRVNWSGYNG